MENLHDLTVEQLLAKLRADAARERRLEREHGIAAEKAERAIAALTDLVGEPEPEQTESLTLDSEAASVNGDGPRGIAAVRGVVSEQPERVWTPREIHAEIMERRWYNPFAKEKRAGTEAAIGRLVRKGELEKVGPGQYRQKEGGAQD